MSGTPGEGRAWAWLDHLQAGGTTPWARWSAEVPTRGRVLPGAQQLELLRRLNLAGGVSPRLAQRVLGASAPGRGRPDLELVGATEVRGFGWAPVDPADLPDDELVRVATGLVAEDVREAAARASDPAAAAPRTARPVLQRVRTAWPWARRAPAYRLAGDPWLGSLWRRELAAAGRPPGGRAPEVLVLAGPLSVGLAHTWSARSAGVDGAPPWPQWLAATTERRHVPRPLDVAAVADRWAARVGRERVRVVVDPDRLPAVVDAPVRPQAPRLSGDAVELVRRVGVGLGLLVLPRARQELLRGVLVPMLHDLPAATAGPRLVVPPEHHRWVARRSVQVRAAVLRAGYPVLGDPDALVDAPDALAEAEGAPPSDAAVLDLAVALLRRHDDRGAISPATPTIPTTREDER